MIVIGEILKLLNTLRCGLDSMGSLRVAGFIYFLTLYTGKGRGIGAIPPKYVRLSRGGPG